jgi:hypothetical protein
MQANEFRILTRWSVEAGISEVAAILMEPELFPDWWGEVYLGIRVLDRGAPDGTGGRIAIHSKGWLPYRLNWTATVTESRAPHGWTVAATGDLTGAGTWTLTQKGPCAEILYDWRVTADRPLFRVMAPVLKPVMAWNHRWAMARGEDGLKREILRRRAATAA